jgi:predicted dinucleotide-binding enzyme
MRIAILGAGRVGASLGAALKANGHVVVFGAREPKVSAGFVTKTINDALLSADAVILTWTAAEALVCEHAPALAGKTIIDATNPLNTNATRLAYGFDTSGAELLQSHAQHATFFKAFNVMGPGAMASPRYPQGLAAAFVAGPSGAQKDVVMGLVRDVGFDAVDVGELRAARLLEPLSMLLMHLEKTGEKGRDLAPVLGSRTTRQAEPCPVVSMEVRKAG